MASNSVSSYVIEVPIKRWRPKPTTNYHPADSECLPDEFFIHKKFGKAIVNAGVDELPPRDDLILWDDDHMPFVVEHLRVGSSCTPEFREQIVNVIKEQWDAFDPAGTRRPVRGIKFHVDTGKAQPICVPQPKYGIHERKIMQAQIDTLLHNGMIEENFGPWAAKLVLAAKPHQEQCTDIVDFIWRMCVNYQPLNRITKAFRFWIPRCAEALQALLDSRGPMYAISVDADSGFHQIGVDEETRDKLAFWGILSKYTWLVMPFGPTSGPSVFQYLMSLVVAYAKKLIDEGVSSSEAYARAEKGAMYVIKNIIDDLLLVSNDQSFLLHVFECVCKAFVHYRLTFKLKKCDFMLDRLEWLGHDWTPGGNLPAQSKFDLIRQWALPATSQALNSFISFCGFYRNFLPWFELEIAPLRRLTKVFKHSSIPTSAWTPELLTLFQKLKDDITSSPCLARADDSQPFFLKTDWSKDGMGMILMQADHTAASRDALAAMENGEPCTFDRTLSGARLRPVLFLARKCSEVESHYHSMVGEAAAGRWAISKSRFFLWGAKFYWITDCSAIQAMVQYDGDNHLLRRWAMDLLGYDFELIHRPERMMKDVDALSRFYNPLVRTYVLRAHALWQASFAASPRQFNPIDLSQISLKGTLADPVATVPTHFTRTIPSPSYETTDPACHVPSSTATFCTILSSHGMRAALHHYENSDERRLTHCNVSFPIVSDHLTSSGGYTTCDDSALAAFSSDYSDLAWITCNSPPGSIDESHSSISPACTLILDRSEARLEFSKKFSPFCVHRLCPSASHLIGDALLLQGFRSFVGYDCTYSPGDGSIESWLRDQLLCVLFLQKRFELQAFLLFLPLTYSPILQFSSLPSDFDLNATITEVLSDAPAAWSFAVSEVHCHQFDDCIQRSSLVVKGMLSSLGSEHFLHDSDIFGNDSITAAPAYGTFIDRYFQERAPASAEFSVSIPPTGSSPASSSAPALFATLSMGPSIVPVLHPSHPACITSLDVRCEFSGTFGVPFENSVGKLDFRPCSTTELFAMLSFDHRVSTFLMSLSKYEQQCIIQECPGIRCFSAVTNRFIGATAAAFIRRSKPSPFATLHQASTCLVLPANVPCATDWSIAYAADPDCDKILAHLRSSTPWTVPELNTVDSLYRPLLRTESISLVNSRLIFYKSVRGTDRALRLIIVPSSLRRRIFEAYHSTPSAGHAGDKKTLWRLRLRFCWPGMRSFVEQACKRCPECILANAVHRPSSALLHGSILDQPMHVLHMDAYSPGNTTSFHSGYSGILTVMCDLSGFVVSIPFTKASSAMFARLLCSDVLFKFGLCSRIVIDDDSKFKGLFKATCDALGIDHIVLSKGNHQGMRCERFHRYLNKVLKIECTRRDTNRVFVEVAMVGTYAWNSMPIDGTDIVRSFVVTGRVFRLPIEVSMDGLPEPCDDVGLSVQRYLSGISADHSLSKELLAILVDDRRTNHRERVNATRRQRIFHVGDIVTAAVQVQSDEAQGKVGKLMYDHRGPYRIVSASGHDSYQVQRMEDPDGALRSFKSSSLQSLPPVLEPCNPLDTIDYRYLNQDRPPILDPLKGVLGIDAYNHLWLYGESPPPAPADQPTAAIPAVTDARNPLVPSIHDLDSELLSDSGSSHLLPDLAFAANDAPTTDFVLRHSDPSTCCADPSALLHAITLSTDKLFFVSYLAEGTFNPKLHIVQVDLQSSARCASTADYKLSGKYYCELLDRVEGDKTLAWNQCRWRTEWHEYTKGPNGEITYGAQRKFKAQNIPNADKYIAYADFLNLTDPQIFVYGPFDFIDSGLTHSGQRKGRDVIPDAIWAAVSAIVSKRDDIELPKLDLQSTTLLPTKQKRQRR